jgi:SAM-dependent methyltransferase
LPSAEPKEPPGPGSYSRANDLTAVPLRVPRRVQKRVFGRDPEAYDRARLPYPSRVYQILATRCGLGRGTAVFEIGPGTGIATRELLRRGADPLLLIEPDRRLARYLAKSLDLPPGRVTISTHPFELARISTNGFDLGIAATSFHWLPERLALRKVARALRPGGWWATWNNHHGDPYRPSPFHRAIRPLYRRLSRGRAGWMESRSSERRDRADRFRALDSVGAFDRISREDLRWTVRLETSRVTALWASFSEIATLPPAPRAGFLAELGRIADEQFGGEVSFPMLTPLYTARRA